MTAETFAALSEPDTRGLMPGIHALKPSQSGDVDGRDKLGHDDDDDSLPECCYQFSLLEAAG
jgi:hypothetical protein